MFKHRGFTALVIAIVFSLSAMAGGAMLALYGVAAAQEGELADAGQQREAASGVPQSPLSELWSSSVFTTAVEPWYAHDFLPGTASTYPDGAGFPDPIEIDVFVVDLVGEDGWVATRRFRFQVPRFGREAERPRRVPTHHTRALPPMTWHHLPTLAGNGMRVLADEETKYLFDREWSLFVRRDVDRLEWLHLSSEAQRRDADADADDDADDADE